MTTSLEIEESFLDEHVEIACEFLNIKVPSYIEFKISNRKGNINKLIGRGVYTIHDKNEAYYVGMSNSSKTGGMRLRFLSHLRKINGTKGTISWNYFLEEYAVAMDLDLDNLVFRGYHMLGYKPSKILALESILIDRLRPIANDEIYNEIMESSSDCN